MLGENLLDLFIWLAAGGSCGTTQETLPTHPYAAADAATCAIIYYAGLAGVLLAAVTLYFGMKALRAMSDGNTPSRFVMRRFGFLTMCWAVLPPIWFWFEYWALYMATPTVGPEGFGQFRYNQALSAAIWAGILAVSIVVLNQMFKQKRDGSPDLEVAEFGEPEPNHYVVTILKSGSKDPKDGKAVWTGKSRVKAVTKFLDFAEKIKDGQDIKLTQEKVLRFHKISERPDTGPAIEDEDA